VDWYDNPAYSNSPYNFSTAVTAPLDLYAKWSQPVVDIYSQSGAHTLAQALNYIKGLATLSEPTPFTIVLDGSSETYTMAGVNYSSSNINKTNAVITLVGKKATTISLSSDGYLFNISAGELVLGKNITLKGITSNSCALVIVRDSTSTLTMKAGAAITDNARSEGNGTGGGVSVYNSGSTFNMEDGTISGNSADRGGGVSVYSGTFKMSGGTISGNSAKLYGGGVYVYDNGGSFNKTEGFIGGDNDNTPHPGNGNATDNTVKDNASGQGHAVYYLKSPGYYRDKTLESGDNISTNTVPLSGIDYNWTKK
jgi:hypothetical protein